MENTIGFRLISSAGFARVEVPVNSTFLDLKKAITNILNVHVKEQKIFSDMQNKKQVNFPDNTPVIKLNLKNGDSIFLSNQSAELNTGKSASSNNTGKKCAHSDRETCINCIGKKKEAVWDNKGGVSNKNNNTESKPSMQEQLLAKSGLTSKCNHKPGQKCLHCMETPSYKGELKFNCQHGIGGKCPNCVDKEFIQDVKHKSFDRYLDEKKEKCKGIHEPSSKCNNCIPPQELVFKIKPGCPNHPPYPEGMCNKCMPPNAVLMRQPYRHVDYVSFMNQEEISLFVNTWMQSFCMKQRMGFLFGYYASDPNYIGGVRAVVEAIYEPPQLGDTVSVEPLQDSDRNTVDRIANSLSLECIGWIYTTISTEKEVCMTSSDIRKAARYQQEYQNEHESGYKVSKFITVVCKSKDNNECELECYMVSDLCQALERDDVFDDPVSKKEMKVRKPRKKNEMIPSVYMESKRVESFDPDFFIVNVCFFDNKLFFLSIFCFLSIFF